MDKDEISIRQGDVYWVELRQAASSAPAGRRPCVVIQSDVFNKSGIGTAVVCTITTSSIRGEAPGNVRLTAGEGGLPKNSVVNISQLVTVDKRDLWEKTGQLDARRVDAIRSGIAMLISRAVQ